MPKRSNKALGELLDENYWKRSRAGNLWRYWMGMTLSVFSRSDNFYGWCIAYGADTQFSNCGFATEEEAKQSMADVFIENHEL